MRYIDPRERQAISYIHVNICITFTQKWDWSRRLSEEEKKERKIMNNNEIHHICVGTRYNKTH
jgi:hypothetical protein